MTIADRFLRKCSPTLGAAVDCLERHDMITTSDEGGDRRWRCTVELMRRRLDQQSE